MNRRTFIGTSTVAGVAIATTGFQCGKPKAVAITIITGAVAELRLLFPDLAVLSKISALAVSFKTAWDAGKFDDARTFFANLDTTIGQVISDLGINATTRVKLILATLGIGLRVVAALIQEQGAAQPGAVKAARARAAGAIDRVAVLSDATAADALLKSSRPQ